MLTLLVQGPLFGNHRSRTWCPLKSSLHLGQITLKLSLASYTQGWRKAPRAEVDWGRGSRRSGGDTEACVQCFALCPGENVGLLLEPTPAPHIFTWLLLTHFLQKPSSTTGLPATTSQAGSSAWLSLLPISLSGNSCSHSSEPACQEVSDWGYELQITPV